MVISKSKTTFLFHAPKSPAKMLSLINKIKENIYFVFGIVHHSSFVHVEAIENTYEILL